MHLFNKLQRLSEVFQKGLTIRLAGLNFDSPAPTSDYTQLQKEEFAQAKRTIAKAEKIAVLTGAGISTSSGIKDFKTLPPYFDEEEQWFYPCSDVLSEWFFLQKPKAFYAYLDEYFYRLHPEPNAGHRFLSDLQEKHQTTIITQNIDGLHEAAGSKDVIHFHGQLDRFWCDECSSIVYPEFTFQDANGIYRHVDANGYAHLLQPDIILYGQSIDAISNYRSFHSVADADVLLVMGTALGVYPAADLVTHSEKAFRIYINKTPPPHPEYFNLILLGDIDTIVSQIS